MDEYTIREREVEVPHTSLDAEVLRRVVEEFVTRDGTDYGVTETPLADRVARVLRQLDSGDARLVYEAESETINIVLE